MKMIVFIVIALCVIGCVFGVFKGNQDDITSNNEQSSNHTENKETEKRDSSFNNAVFLIPVLFDNEDDNTVLDAPDYNLHVMPKAALAIEEGHPVMIKDSDDFPDYKPQTKPGEQQNIHLRMLKNGATGLEYIPLFVSYQSMFAIFGQNIHVGLISFADAKDFAKECEGIVLGPGVFNKIFTKEMLSEEQ